MFKVFKEKKLKKELELFDFHKSFDIEYSENYQLDSKETSPLKTNTYVFSAHSFEKRQTIYIRLAINPVQTEAIIYYIEGFNKYILEQQIYTTTCPLKIFKEDNIWNVNFSGYLKKNNKDNVKLTFQSKFESSNECIEKSRNYNTNNIFECFKNEKNYKDKIDEIVNNDNVYYTQLGNIKGRMILEGQNSTFNLPCAKEHFYGLYDYSKCNNHINLIIPTKESLVNFQQLSESNIISLEIGNYYKNTEKPKYVNKVVYERQLFVKGTPPTYLNILLHLDTEEQVAVYIKKIDEIEFEQQEQYDFHIAVVEVLMEGKKYRGIMECGYNKNQELWFNGIDISKL